ncbi:AAA family ATPase [uncultured Clostridium sp.]|jgi:chromosome partitioning protein|uniref:ParA family protein n=1 Tax=uncultured Clostridium sp. TaxID=59620 RepID=UPI00260CFFA8|nr:AAA family ATPase [uncultured Clostridium sp.]
MKTISIFNQKGGVGKTTTNINICAYLATLGYKILAIDIDPQGNTTSGLGVDKRKITKSMYDVLCGRMCLEDIIIQSQLVENLYIAPANMDLAGAEIEVMARDEREFILHKELGDLEDKFDFVFIDCPPSLGMLTINSLVASQSVLIPIQAEYYALEGVAQLVNTVNLVKKSLNKNLEVEGAVMTMYDSRTNLSNEVYKEVKGYFADKLYEATIPRNIRLAEAPSFGLPIVLYDDKCRGAQAYENLTNEFLKRQGVEL